MNGKLQKFLGWCLLLIGLSTIGWSLYSSYNIFSGKKAPPIIFKIESQELPPASQKKKISNLTPEELEKQISALISEQLNEIIPKETINHFFNIIAWSIFAGILIFAGGQVASLGIKMQK